MRKVKHVWEFSSTGIFSPFVETFELRASTALIKIYIVGVFRSKCIMNQKVTLYWQ